MESSYQECSTTCFGQISCIGFAISGETATFPDRCYVYGNISQQNAPSGWMEYRQQYFEIHTTNHNSTDVMCYQTISVGNVNKQATIFDK